MSQVPYIGGNADLQETINETNAIAREVNAREVVQVFKDDTGTRRVILGKTGDGQYGLKVSKPEYDVFEAANNDLIFNSQQNVPKIVSSGNLTITASTGTSTTDIVDISGLGLTSPPLIICAAQTPASAATYHPMPFINSPGTTTEVIGTAWVNFVDLTKDITFQVRLGASASGYAGDWTFRYYVLQESAG